MKKSVVIAALGLAVSAVSSFGQAAQGSIAFNSYTANSSVGIRTLFSAALGGTPVGAGFSADLLWSLTPIADTSGNGSLNPSWNFSGNTGAGSVQSVITPFGTAANTSGYFQGQNFFLNSATYTAGQTIFFEIIAYQTAAGSYANSLERGHSAEFSSTLATGLNQPADVSFAPFTVSTVPEPTTLALAGLGGLAALVGFRRKNV